MFRNQTKTQSMHRIKLNLKSKRPSPFTPSFLISVTRFARSPEVRPVSDQLRTLKRQGKGIEFQKSKQRRQQNEQMQRVQSVQTSFKRFDQKEQYQQNKINQNVTDEQQHPLQYKDSLRQLQLQNFKLNQRIGALKYSLKKLTGHQTDPLFFDKIKRYDSNWNQKVKAAQLQCNKRIQKVVAEKDESILKILNQKDGLLKLNSKLQHRIADLAEQLDQAHVKQKARDIQSMKDYQADSLEQLAKTSRKLQAAQTRIQDMTRDYVRLLDENRRFRNSISCFQTQIFNYKTQLQQMNLLKLKLEEKDKAERSLLLRWERSREQVEKLNLRIGDVQKQLDQKAGLDLQVLNQIQIRGSNRSKRTSRAQSSKSSNSFKAGART